MRARSRNRDMARASKKEDAMIYEKELKEWFEAHFDEYLEDLKLLVSINSEKGEAKPDMPFGEGPEKALQAALGLFEKYGFRSENFDHYAITAKLNQEAVILDVMAHLDVVPAGAGWTVTDPFTLKVQDGRVYGRGTADDKGPALCALYAMRALKELGLPVTKGIKLILGTDEECGSSDMEYYFSKAPHALYTFSPDADFPLINIEKGALHSGFTMEYTPSVQLPRLLSVHGGVKINMVPNEASASAEGLDRKELDAVIGTVSAETGASFEIAENGETVTITAKGRNAHASTPEEGINAITALLALLSRLSFAPSKETDAIQAIAKLFPHGDFYGHGLGVDLSDERSGKTTLTLDILHLDNGSLSGMFDARVSIIANKENTADVISRRFEEAGLVSMDNPMSEPHIVDENSPLVVKLLKAYSDVTGKDARPIAIGGGTYVHEIENGVAFGCAEEGVDNHMHGADEFMVIDQILKSCMIFAQAFLSICA